MSETGAPRPEKGPEIGNEIARPRLGDVWCVRGGTALAYDDRNVAAGELAADAADWQRAQDGQPPLTAQERAAFGPVNLMLANERQRERPKPRTNLVIFVAAPRVRTAGSTPGNVVFLESRSKDPRTQPQLGWTDREERRRFPVPRGVGGLNNAISFFWVTPARIHPDFPIDWLTRSDDWGTGEYFGSFVADRPAAEAATGIDPLTADLGWITVVRQALSSADPYSPAALAWGDLSNAAVAARQAEAASDGEEVRP